MEYINERQGEFPVVTFKTSTHYNVFRLMDIMSDWSRNNWGPAAVVGTKEFKWRRRWLTFTFKNDNYRDLFLLRISDVKLDDL